MTRMTFQEQVEDDGGSLSVDAYLGDYITVLQALRLPLRMESAEGGHHLPQLLNLFYSMADLLGNVGQLFVYKDSTDTDVQYSVSAGALLIGGSHRTYAGQINRGNLTVSNTNYIWLDCRDPTTLVAASATTGWPTYPHVKLGTIAQPGSGPWRPADLVRFGGAQALNVSGVGQVAALGYKQFTYATSSPMLIGTAPKGCVIDEVVLKIGTTFNGSGAALSVGDSGSAVRHMGTGDNTPGSTGAYTKRNYYEYSAGTDVNLYITPGSGASQGAGFVYVKYVEAP